MCTYNVDHHSSSRGVFEAVPGCRSFRVRVRIHGTPSRGVITIQVGVVLAESFTLGRGIRKDRGIV